MDQKKGREHHTNNFVWGLIIGGGLMYLLTTPNGRKILKEISEGGIDKLSEVIDFEQLHALHEELGEEFNEKDFEGVEQEAKTDIAEKRAKKRFFKRAGKK